MYSKEKYKRTVKYVIKILVFVYLFLFVPKGQVLAQTILINEFSSNSDTEWVELYNVGSETVDLTGWKISDAAQPPETLTGTISGNSYFVFEKPSGWLNNSGGDVITLKDASDALKDSVAYGTTGSIVGTPSSDKSAGRVPDGSNNWQNNLVWSKGAANPTPTPTPTPSPTATPAPTPTPTLTPTPTPTSAPAPTKTPTPTPKLALASTKAPTPTRQPTGAPKDATVGAVLGATPEASPTPGAVAGFRSFLPAAIALALVGLGLALLAGVFIWKKRGAWASKKDEQP